MISVADFMTKDLVTVRETDDLALAESLLRLGGIRHLLVVRERKLVGILTSRDVLRSGSAGRPIARELPVSDVMTREPTSIRPATGLAHAARLMLERKFGCLPVSRTTARSSGSSPRRTSCASPRTWCGTSTSWRPRSTPGSGRGAPDRPALARPR
jgi:CBS-domain-containing membrane protein